MTKLISECISNENFTTFGYKIVIRNETSHTQLTKPELISIKEIKDNGIVLEVPLNSCQKSHSLTLFFLNQDANTTKLKLPGAGHYKEALIEAIGKVDHLEPNESKKNSVYIDLTFTQIDLKLWKKIIAKYSDNQTKIDDMLLGQHIRRGSNE